MAILRVRPPLCWHGNWVCGRVEHTQHALSASYLIVTFCQQCNNALLLKKRIILYLSMIVFHCTVRASGYHYRAANKNKALAVRILHGASKRNPKQMCGKRARRRVTAPQFCKKGPECSSPTNERRAWVSNLWDSS